MWLIRLVSLLLTLTLFLVLIPLSSFAKSEDDYHPLSIASILSMDVSHPKHWHSHVETSGFIEYIHKEKDGDIHIRLSDVTSKEIIAECIPQIPLCYTLNLHKGEAVKVRGLLYYDYKHVTTQGGWEIHPITWIQEIK